MWAPEELEKFKKACKAPVGNMVQIRDLSAGNGLQAQAYEDFATVRLTQ